MSGISRDTRRALEPGGPAPAPASARTPALLSSALVLAIVVLGVLRRPPAAEPAPAAHPAAHPAAGRADTAAEPVRAPGEEGRRPVTSVRALREEPHPRPAAGGVSVTVVDAGGRPAPGVDVALGARSGERGRFEGAARARTDERGRAWLALPARGRADELVVRAEILAADVPEVDVEPEAGASASVVLHLPATGTVRLEGFDAEGQPVRTPVSFGVRARLAAGGELPRPALRRLASERGAARLEHVGLGLDLFVVGTPEDGAAEDGAVRSGGPRVPGEVVTIEVPIGEAWPTVSLRAVDPQGRPLAHATLDGAFVWSSPASRLRWLSVREVPVSLETDGEGRASLPVRGRVQGGHRRSLRLRQEVGGDARESAIECATRSAEVDLSRELPRGSTLDLGDLVFRPDAPREEEVVWVAGRVVDADGAPVAGATVLVAPLEDGAESGVGPGASARTGPDGTFAAKGPPGPARLAVRVVADGRRHGAPLEVPRGSTGVQLALRPVATWSAELRLDADIPPTALAVDVGSGELRQRARVVSGRVVADGLEPGALELEVRTRAGDWLVERRSDLWASSGSAGEGAESVALDLRGRLRRLRLRLLGPDGAPLHRVHARVTPEPWPEAGAWIREGILDLVVPADATRISVRPIGHDTFDVEALDGVQEIRCLD